MPELRLCLMTERMSFIYPKGIRVSAIIGDESVKFGQILIEKVQNNGMSRTEGKKHRAAVPQGRQ